MAPPPSHKGAPPRVLLVGNYPPDRQPSMRRFTELLAEGLRRAGVDAQVFTPPVIAGRLGARPSGPGKWIGYIDKYLLAPRALRARLRRAGPGVVAHICDHSYAHLVAAVRRRPHLVTCHDLLAVRSALGEFAHNRPGPTGRIQQAIILRGLKRAACIASVSEATRDDVRRLVGGGPARAHVVPNAIDPVFARAAAGRLDTPPLHECLRLPDRAPFVLHVGGEKWYKNRVGALRIFRALAEEEPGLHLVAVGPPFDAARLAEAGATGLVARIHCLQNIDDLRLAALYRTARLLLFPSRIEGFGWPIVEAQACGCPALTLDRPPMNALNATPALRVDADVDARGWAETAAVAALPHIHAGPTERECAAGRLRAFARGFSIEAAVAAYLRLYQDLASDPAP